MNIVKLVNWIAQHPLNRRRPDGAAKALLRLLRWQIASRIMPVRMALPFVDNTYLLVERGMTGASGNWYCGLHEPDEMSFVLHALRADDRFIDIGANIGSYSILSAGAVGAHITSIEPIPLTFQRLTDNININKVMDRAELLNVGLSDRPGTLRFTMSLDTMNRVAIDGDQADCVDIPVRTLDDIMQGRAVDMIKIDVEGHELSVLRGAALTLARPELKAVIMETNHSGAKYGVSDEELIAEIQKYGFSAYTYDIAHRTLLPAAKGTANTIFVRDADLLTTLCRSARSFKLLNGTI